MGTVVTSWTNLKAAVSDGGTLAITLASPFQCDYNAQIDVPDNSNITICGNGQVLDASLLGRFFNIPQSASNTSLTLASLTLQHGSINGAVSLDLSFSALLISYFSFLTGRHSLISRFNAGGGCHYLLWSSQNIERHFHWKYRTGQYYLCGIPATYLCSSVIGLVRVLLVEVFL